MLGNNGGTLIHDNRGSDAEQFNIFTRRSPANIEFKRALYAVENSTRPKISLSTYPLEDAVISCTFEGGSSVAIYYNGVKAASYTISDGAKSTAYAMFVGNTTTTLNGTTPNTNLTWTGLVKSLRVYDTALTDAQVAQNATAEGKDVSATTVSSSSTTTTTNPNSTTTTTAYDGDYEFETVWSIEDYNNYGSWYTANANISVSRTYGETLAVDTEDNSLKATATQPKDSIFLNINRSDIDLTGSVGLRVKLKRSAARNFSLGVSSDSNRYWQEAYGSNLSALAATDTAPAYMIYSTNYNNFANTASTEYAYYNITWAPNPTDSSLKTSSATTLKYRATVPSASGNNYFSDTNGMGGYDSTEKTLTDDFISSIESLYILFGEGGKGETTNIMSVEAIFPEGHTSTTKYSVTYAGDTDIISSIPSGRTVVAGKTVTLPSVTTSTGYVFDGWKCSVDNETYAAGTVYTPTEDVTFTAVTSVETINYDGPYVSDGIYAIFDGTKPNGSTSATDVTYWQSSISSAYAYVGEAGDTVNKFTGEGYLLNNRKCLFSDGIKDLMAGNAFTVEVKFGEFSAISNSFNTFLNSDNDSFSLFRRANKNQIELKSGSGGGNTRVYATDADSTLPNSLITITATVGGSVKLYVNGELKDTATYTSASNVNTFFFGHTSNTFQALYKSMRFYNRALTESEVVKNAKVDGYTPGEEDEYKVDIETLTGASMRIPGSVSGVNSGVRFHSNVDTAKINALIKEGCTVEAGTLISPKDVLGDNLPTLSTSNTINVSYNVVGGNYYNDSQIVGTIANIKSTSSWNGSTGNIGRRFVARGYVKVTDTSDTTHIYYSSTTSSRSLKYIANAFRMDTTQSSTYASCKDEVDSWADALYITRNTTFNTYSTTRTDGETTKVIAHRGEYNDNYGATQNSITSFMQAGESGYWGTECDVHYTSDGKFIVCHDSSTGNVSEKNINIEGSTYEQVRKVQLKDGSRIPSIEEYLKICVHYGLHPVIEIKNNGWSIANLTNLVATVNSIADLNNVVFIAFDRTNLTKVKTILDESYSDKTVKLQDLNSLPEDYETYLTTAKELGLDIDPSYSNLSSTIVDFAHELGMEVNCWTFYGNPSKYVAMNVDYVSGEHIAPAIVQNNVNNTTYTPSSEVIG